MHIKNVRVNNNKNVLVQIPGFISNKWALLDNDMLEVHLSNDGESVIIRPKKIRAGSDTDKESKRMA